MATYQFAYLIAFLADAARLLNILCQAMQVANPTYDDVKHQVDSCIVAIQALRNMKGPHLEAMSKKFPVEAACGETIVQGHDFKDTEQQRLKAQDTSIACIDNITTRLGTIFPDGDIMEAFQTLFTRQQDDDTLIKKNLIDFYGVSKTCKGETHAPLVDPNATVQEWNILQNLAGRYNTQHTMGEFLQRNNLAYPNLWILSQIVLTIPVTSVNCERMISRYNAAKTDSRSSMQVDTVERLLTLNTEAAQFKEFPYQDAFAMWKNKGARRFGRLGRH